MTAYTLTEGQVSYWSNLAPNWSYGETGNVIFGNSLSNNIYGNGYDDFIYGGDGSDRLYGNGGDDVIVGGSGDDQISGGVGDDALYGSSGTNILDGGTGDDELYGGSGNDTFLFDFNGGGIDIVSSFYGADNGWDTLQISGTTTDDLLFYEYGADGESLLITTGSELSDGSLDNAIIIEDYFSQPNLGLVDVVYVYDSNGVYDGGFYL